jgi:chromosome partitioning protein
MTIILIGQTKGGCGKSTVAVQIAVTLAQQGKDCLLLDADRQTSVSEWWAERQLNHPNHPKIHCMQKYGDIEESLHDLSLRYQYVVVDVAGRDSEELRSAMMSADTLLIPIKPSAIDNNALNNMMYLVQKALVRNKKLTVYGFLSIAPTTAKGQEITQARQAISEYPDILLLNALLSDRKIFRDTFADGLGVTETNGRAESDIRARAEVIALAVEVLHGEI